MPVCKNAAELERQMRRRINTALKTKIADLVKSEIQKSTDDVVYAAGGPKVYKRRKDNGGLRDTQNMTAVLDEANCSVRVYNDASASGKNFDPLDEKIEYGYASSEEGATWYNQPRPFMDTAQEAINRQEQKIRRMLQHAVDYGG